MEIDHKPTWFITKANYKHFSENAKNVFWAVIHRFKLVHVQEKKLYIVDALSRSATNIWSDMGFLVDEDATVHTIPSATKERASELQNATKDYEDLLNLQLFIHNGWAQQY